MYLPKNCSGHLKSSFGNCAKHFFCRNNKKCCLKPKKISKNLLFQKKINLKKFPGTPGKGFRQPSRNFHQNTEIVPGGPKKMMTFFVSEKNLENFLRKRKIRFRKLCLEVFRQKCKMCCSKPEKKKEMKTNTAPKRFSSKNSSWHAECNFTNLPRNFLRKSELLAQSPKFILKNQGFEKNMFPPKFFLYSRNIRFQKTCQEAFRRKSESLARSLKRCQK